MKITLTKRRAIWGKTNGRCYFCGRPNAGTIEHLLPRTRGGTGKTENLVLACVHCNSYKSDWTLEELREFTSYQVMVLHASFGIQVRPVSIHFCGELIGGKLI